MGTRKTLENMQTAIDNAYDSIEEMGGDVPQARNLVNLSGTIDDLQNSVIAGVRGTNDAYQSTGKSYTKGESCIYNNVVYTAKDAISAPAGEFDPSKWDESSLASLRSSISDISDTFEVERINCYGYTLGTSKAITPRPYKRIGFAFGVFATVWDSQLIIPFNVTIPKDSTSITVSSLTLTTSSSSLVTSGTYDFILFTFRLS